MSRLTDAWFVIVALGLVTSDVQADNGVQPANLSEPPASATAAKPLPWLKGSTHVHAAPSGDSTTPIEDVIAWYQAHGYDFIALTDHNRVSEINKKSHTKGKSFVRNPDKGLIVLAGVELTHNPDVCEPPPPADDPKCRIHLNAIGVTARPDGKIKWAERKNPLRTAMYAKGIATTKQLGRKALAQLNHPQWHWGMTDDVLQTVIRDGVQLLEIANVQFATWNAGDATHDSMEVLWDKALTQGLTVWGVASDDAHDYNGEGKYPAGGGFVVINAKRKPEAILTALREGNFYSSTGVLLSKLEVKNARLTIEVATTGVATGTSVIEFIENGKVVETVNAEQASRAIPSAGYLRATVTRSDGAKAWIQPQRISSKSK
jgi:hypothetical protein